MLEARNHQAKRRMARIVGMTIASMIATESIRIVLSAAPTGTCGWSTPLSQPPRSDTAANESNKNSRLTLWIVIASSHNQTRPDLLCTSAQRLPHTALSMTNAVTTPYRYHRGAPHIRPHLRRDRWNRARSGRVVLRIQLEPMQRQPKQHPRIAGAPIARRHCRPTAPQTAQTDRECKTPAGAGDVPGR